MKKLLTYLSVIGVCLGLLPSRVEAGSRDKKKRRYWGHHHGYYAREYYRHYQPHHYWRYPYYYGYYRYPYQYSGYPGRSGSALVFNSTNPKLGGFGSRNGNMDRLSILRKINHGDPAPTRLD